MAGGKTIFVAGATGNQGGAVASFLSSNGFAVKGLSRKPDSSKARLHKGQNIELVKGNLNEPGSYRKHLEGVDGIFSVQHFKEGVDKEISQGIALANLAKESGIKHFLYSSVLGADLHSGVPAFESKFTIENHIRSLGIPFTIIRPATLFENFLIPQVKKGIDKGKLVQPINKDTVVQYLACADIGKAALRVFQQPENFLGKTIPLSAEQWSTGEVADIFSRSLNRSVEYKRLHDIIVRLFLGKNLYIMFKWVNAETRVDKKDIEIAKTMFPDLMSLSSWIDQFFKGS
jgi:uncharacterized protein YbjT (DUF2867 family)